MSIAGVEACSSAECITDRVMHELMVLRIYVLLRPWPVCHLMLLSCKQFCQVSVCVSLILKTRLGGDEPQKPENCSKSYQQYPLLSGILSLFSGS